ncbi:hypothetical protein L9F63_012138, partial [Diploptera punctata]
FLVSEVVFGETSENFLPQDHGQRARKSYPRLSYEMSLFFLHIGHCQKSVNVGCINILNANVNMILQKLENIKLFMYPLVLKSAYHLLILGPLGISVS